MAILYKNKVGYILSPQLSNISNFQLRSIKWSTSATGETPSNLKQTLEKQ